MKLALQLAAAIVTGILLRFVVGLEPIWWLAWIAPAALLLLAFKSSRRDARWMLALAVLIGVSANFHYFRLVMPLSGVFAVLAGQALLWLFIVNATKRVITRYPVWWSVFVYPALWAAVDTLLAALLPDGNWGSLAYSQGDMLPILQVASLFGVAGLLFLLALVPSALALAVAYGRNLRRGWIAYAITLVLLGATIGYGVLRLQTPTSGQEMTLGLASIDDAIGPRASEVYAENIRQQYDRHVAALAAQGAQVVVLPEKIAVLPAAQLQQWQQHFSELAAQHKVWLEVGIALSEDKGVSNLSWLFTPQGTLDASYQKHYLAPPERGDYLAGSDYAVRSIDAQPFGLAICKDMHFAALGRNYGAQGVAAMLVPAWDFGYLDAWLEARTTLTRGVENGYAVIRASREGLLTVSDAYGRVVAEQRSSPLPGSTLLAKLRVGERIPTLYARIGDLFGWLCVAAAALFVAIGRWKQPRR